MDALTRGIKMVAHIVFDFGQHRLVVGAKIVVLCAQHNGLNALWGAIVFIFNGHQLSESGRK